MPASKANRDSGPSMPNSDADTITMSRPRTGIDPPTSEVKGRSDVRDGLDTGAS
jgi:hypothetical protein